MESSSTVVVVVGLGLLPGLALIALGLSLACCRAPTVVRARRVKEARTRKEENRPDTVLTIDPAIATESEPDTDSFLSRVEVYENNFNEEAENDFDLQTKSEVTEIDDIIADNIDLRIDIENQPEIDITVGNREPEETSREKRDLVREEEVSDEGNTTCISLEPDKACTVEPVQQAGRRVERESGDSSGLAGWAVALLVRYSHWYCLGHQ